MKQLYYLFALSLCLTTWSVQAQNWQLYDASVIPADADFSTNGGSANATATVMDDPDIPGNKVLRFISPDPSSQYSFTNTVPFSVDQLTLAMRVRGLPDVDTLARLFDIDVRLATVDLREKFIIDYDGDLKFERSGESIRVDNTTDWHIYRFVCNGAANEWSLYVDESDTPILQSASPDGTGDQYFKMGDGSGGNSMGALIDWVVWDTTGAFTPQEQALPELTGTDEDVAQIAFLTNQNWRFFDEEGYYADSLFVADLEAQGYEVSLLDYSAYASVDADEANVLKTADLVILGRGISSGDFDDADDVIWTELKTPIILMSNYVARANRLGYIASNEVEDFADLDTFYAEVVNTDDVIFDGLTIPMDGIIPYAENYLGAVLAEEDMTNGEVLLRLEGVGTAYRLNSSTGDIEITYDMADFDGNILMARWAPGDSMYLTTPTLPGFRGPIPQGYRSYITVGHDRDYSTEAGARLRDYYVFTDFMQQAWINEVANLIELGNAGNADLQTITVDGVSINFDPYETDLAFQFLAGTAAAHMPVVNAIPQAADARVEITQPNDANGMATITVTSSDGSVSKTYTLNLSVGQGEGVIIYVTNTDWVEFESYGAYADSFFVADLEAAGYDVYVTPYSNYSVIDEVEAAALEMADLVVLGRGISSGDFDDADDVIWAELNTPIVLMSNFVARANRLGWFRSNTVQDFARLETYEANVVKADDNIFAGATVREDGRFAYAEENLGIVIADESQINGEVLVTLAGVGEAYRIDNGNGSVTDTFDLAEFDGNILMARWSPGDSMYLANADLPGFTSVVPNGYRTYVTVGHDREFSTELNTRLRDYYSLTPTGNTLWLNEVDNLIELANEQPYDGKYALLSDLTVDGVTIDGFDPLDFEYTIEVPEGTMPDIAGVPAYTSAAVNVMMPASLPDTARVEVVSEDGLTALTYSIVIDVITGTDDPRLAGIQIYPNPVHDQLIVELPEELSTGQLSLYTTLGQRLTTHAIDGTRVQMPVNSLPDGLYLLRIEVGERAYTQKIIKR